MIILTEGWKFLIEITLIILASSSPSGFEDSLFDNIKIASACLIFKKKILMKNEIKMNKNSTRLL